MRLGYGCSSIGFGLAKGSSSAGYLSLIFEIIEMNIAARTSTNIIIVFNIWVPALILNYF